MGVSELTKQLSLFFVHKLFLLNLVHPKIPANPFKTQKQTIKSPTNHGRDEVSQYERCTSLLSTVAFSLFLVIVRKLPYHNNTLEK
ncbi:MAG: hypothetical protein ACW963_09850, partial [Candidatus Sifarchaeia archaeon]